MNKDIAEGKWTQLKGEIIKRWGKITDDRLDVLKGDATKLAGQVQEAYGISRDEAEEQVRQWEKDRRKMSSAA